MAAAPQGGASAKPFEFKGVYLGDSPEVVAQKLKSEAKECTANPNKSVFGESSLECTDVPFGNYKATDMTGYFVEGKLALLAVKHADLGQSPVSLLAEKFEVNPSDIAKDKTEKTLISDYCKTFAMIYTASREILTIVDSKGGKIQSRSCGMVRSSPVATTFLIDESLVAKRTAGVEAENRAAQADRAKAAEEQKKNAISKF